MTPSRRRVSDLREGEGVEHTHVGASWTTTGIFGRSEYSVRLEQGATVLVDCTGGTTRIAHSLT